MNLPRDAAVSEDLSALAWVYDELRRSLDNAHKALRRYLKEHAAAGDSDVDSADPAVLRQARNHVHQGAGALELVGLSAAARILQASEAALVRIGSRPKLLNAAAVETIERGSFALLDFLGRMLAGKPVPTLALFPQYRALQELAGASRVHPADLWSRDFQWRDLAADTAAEGRAPDAATVARVEREMLAMMRGTDAGAATRMSQLFADLGAGARGRTAVLWRLASAFFEAQAAGLLKPDVYSKRVGSRLLAQLRAGTQAEPSERLAQDLLFFCAQAGTGPASPRLDAARAAWQMPPADGRVDYEAARLGRFDPALLAQARKRVAGAKDVWSAVAGGELVRLPGLVEQFALVGDSVQRLYPAGDALAHALQASAHQTVSTGAEPAAGLAMEVATGLLYLDASLEDGDFDHPQMRERVQRLAMRIDAARSGQDSGPLELWMEELYRRVSDRQTMGSVVQELRASLSEVEKQIDQYFRHPAEREVLIPVPAQLSAMRGVLSVLGMDQASQAVVRMRDDVDALASTEVDPQRAVQAGTFDRLADNLGALSFLIDMVSVQPQMAKSLFHFDATTGNLKAVMGRADRPTGFGEFDAAPRVEPAQALAQDIARQAAQGADEQSLVRGLDQLAHQARAADQDALADAAAKARRALDGAVGETAREAVRAQVAEQMAGFVAAAAPPVQPVAPPVAVPPPGPPAAPGQTGLEDDDEMRDVFLEEAREVIATARAGLEALAHSADDVAELTTVRRAFHTLKGSSRMVGLKDFGEAAWSCEQLYNARLADSAPADADLREFSGEALDYLESWVDAIERRQASGHDAAAVATAADAMRLQGRRIPVPPVAPPAALPVLEPVPASAPAPVPLPDLLPEPLPEPAPEPVLQAPAPSALETPVPLPVLDDLRAQVPDLPSAADLDFSLDFGGADATPAAAAPTVALDLDRVDALVSIDLPAAQEAPSWDALPTIEPAVPTQDTDAMAPLAAPQVEEVEFELDLGAFEAAAKAVTGPIETPAPEIELIGDGPPELVEPAVPGPPSTDLPAFDLPEEADASGLTTADALPPLLPEVDVLPMPEPEAPTSPQFDEAAPLMPVEALEPEAIAFAPFDQPAMDAVAVPDAEPPAATQPESVAPVEPDVVVEAEAVAQAEVEAEKEAEEEAEEEDAEQYKMIGPLKIGITLFNIYLNEADELSRRLTIDLAEWAHELARPVSDQAVALAHSLAGSSATVGYADLSQLARALEHALMRAQVHGTSDSADAELFNEAAEQIRHLLHQFAAGFLRPAPEALLQRLHDYEPALRAAAPFVAPEEPAADVFDEPVAPVVEAPAAAVESTPAAQALDEPQEMPEPTPMAIAATPLPTSFGELGRPEVKPFSALEAADEQAPVPAAHRDALDAAEGIDVADAIDAELFPIFEEEALDLLPQLHSRMREWSHRPSEAPAASACMRTLHTLKGGARLAGAMRLGEMAHRLETAIEHLVGAGAPQAADVERLMQRVDAIETVFENLRRGPATPAPAVPVAVADLGAVPSQVALAPAPEAQVQSVHEAELLPVVEDQTPDVALEPASDATPAMAAPATRAPVVIDWSRFAPGEAAVPEAPAAPLVGTGAAAAVRVRASLLDRLVNHAGEVSITRSRIESDVGQIKGVIGDLTDNLDKMRRQLRDIELQAETQIESRLEAAKATSAQFDPLEMDRFTRFQELTRMMAESVNDVATVQRSLQRSLQSTEDELAAQARLTRDLQDDLLRTRMVEFEGLSERLYRVVRQAAKETGKQVRLDIVGGSIEIDRGVLERMTGAFEHLLRNCVAHGIEPPERRTAAGKDATGTVTIAVRQEGNEVGIEFRDDGAGLDLARIRSRAVAQGLIAPDAQPAESELVAMIYMPGFTTAEVVTGLAGRGVGMDVVRAEVAAMGGRIETATAAGQGSSFKLVLPLTTAVTQVVMLRCGEMRVAVPSTLVEIVNRVAAADVASAYASGQYVHGGRAMPFFWLASLLEGSATGTVPGRTAPVVVIRSAAQRVALHVDEVIGNQEVVVKNLGPQLARMPGLAGMTLLPSGQPALIYNPVALATLYGESARAATLAALAGPAAVQPRRPAEAAAPQAPLVLVVDDSLTVRRVTQRLLVREGYRVTVAKDGLEGLEKLSQERPAVLLTDIEMPRMDGFDLVRTMRVDAKLADLPVIMITSRIAQKHRDYASELGVDHYLGKPYSEEDLLALVARYARAGQPA